MNKLQDERKRIYKRYLRSKEWKNLRQYCYDHFSGICQSCYKVFDLKDCHIHHLSYENLGNEIVGKDIILLCKWCHEIEHPNHIKDKYNKRKNKKAFTFNKYTLTEAAEFFKNNFYFNVYDFSFIDKDKSYKFNDMQKLINIYFRRKYKFNKKDRAYEYKEYPKLTKKDVVDIFIREYKRFPKVQNKERVRQDSTKYADLKKFDEFRINNKKNDYIIIESENKLNINETLLSIIDKIEKEVDYKKQIVVILTDKKIKSFFNLKKKERFYNAQQYGIDQSIVSKFNRINYDKIYFRYYNENNS